MKILTTNEHGLNHLPENAEGSLEVEFAND